MEQVTPNGSANMARSYNVTVSFAELDVNHLLDYELSTKFGCNERSDCTIAFQQTATTSKNMPVISGSR